MIDLYLKNCMDLMKDYADNHFDLAIVDPPYGIKRDKGFRGFGGFGGFGKPIARKQYKGEWDSAAPKESYFVELLRVSKNQIVWGGNFFTDKLPVNGHWLFWDKLNTMPTFSDGELAWTSFNRTSVKRKILEYNGLLGKEKNRIHPTQKPVALYKWLLKNYAKAGDKILDTHLGSGSIAIACYDMGFDLTACELDPDYFRDMRNRLEFHARQADMFQEAQKINFMKGTEIILLCALMCLMW